MKRVKPLYLCRTYGVPLPDPDDPSKSWEPEAFLEKLARMKGRLLKGGEPDLEGVSKIVLSDWVRGRIPFFVSPPERPEELNEEEERKRKKGKGKEVFVPDVHQKLSGIIQKNTFVGEDVKPIDEEPAVDEEWTGFDDENDVPEATANATENEPSIQNEAEGLAWDDVFNEDKTTKKREGEEDDENSPESSGDDEGDGDGSEQGWDSASENSNGKRRKTRKEPRMTTNKVRFDCIDLYGWLTLSTIEKSNEFLLCYKCEKQEQKQAETKSSLRHTERKEVG